MNKLTAALAVLLFNFSAVAQTLPSVTCTLVSVDGRESATQEINNKDGEIASSKPLGDLTFDLAVNCEKDDCAADLTFYSAMIQDEVNSTSFKFSKKAEGHIYAEVLTNAPDKKKYEIFCELRHK